MIDNPLPDQVMEKKETTFKRFLTLKKLLPNIMQLEIATTLQST